MNTLERTASQMRRILTGSNARYCHRRLHQGLELVLERREQNYRLALGRRDRPPSDDEIELCRRAFRAPTDAEPKHIIKIRSGKTGPCIYHVAELFWIELN